MFAFYYALHIYERMCSGNLCFKFWLQLRKEDFICIITQCHYLRRCFTTMLIFLVFQTLRIHGLGFQNHQECFEINEQVLSFKYGSLNTRAISFIIALFHMVL